MSKAIVIYNPLAGGSASVRETIVDLTARHDCELRLLREASELSSAVHEAAVQRAARIIIAGGDGSISQAMNALLPIFGQVEFGLLPLGTGNDLARSLDIPTGDLEQALDIAVHRPASAIDVVHVHNGISTHFVNAATGGFGGEVTAALTAANKQAWGPFAYWMTAMTKLVDLHAFDVQLEFDGELSEMRVYGIGLANGRYIGGGFPLAPTALLNDGLMDVALIPEMPALDLLSAGISYMLGRQAVESSVITRQARRVVMRSQPPMSFSLDGEPTRSIDAFFEVLPSALRIAVGDNPALLQAKTTD